MESKSPKKIKTLKELRERIPLTQPELSQRLGTGIRIIGDWEAGRKVPRFDNAIALARVLGVSLKTLAQSMGLEVLDIIDDGLPLSQLKSVCEELGIERVSDIPDSWNQLSKRKRKKKTD
ncbi:MAG TPA: helix-turn-helix transcriptional regulator [Nostocaceae cyanobacterium]|nr:helix-turn-helix transcriptional regulator [Nostocaceae cyanobacterium]